MDLSRATVLFIGCGNMGSALVLGLKKLHVGRVLLFDIDQEKTRALAALSGAEIADDLVRGVGAANMIVLAIKPQHLKPFLASHAPLLRPDQILISILAGIKTASLRASLSCRLARAMPNTPALAGMGFTAICGPDAEAVNCANAIFSCVGTVITVDEDAMDAVTALSGAGPAYVFYFAEMFQKAAREAGFGAEEARTLMQQTMAGALRLLADPEKTPESLRAQVTSPGGVTEAAIGEMKRLGFENSILQGIMRGIERSKALGT
ncbi:MAG: pyrroline-5-carboxylate reductase [Candidatus Raymondbacteria bacterium RifOxyC12_full_50_8]|nr:MAG: pyrroline-5-carboxylate reductase [Candidatus Raymondbacteria bacterium RIFOXYA2_FULL_49_16]OGJ93459.1 MAG: pyrroline-5-carboxylate reductase [Candidatus Raymondbacteria bacterium RifOxyB12_full_50_8]OGK07977.1 MAG: pyrroline-5-carboxylate reductase [Candidatus Raymondbacteria bacterium RifOxyC12_full_50_8]OGP42435.1 MAG: pyrroline-5-carboxylate reductase [Candidatus Raymondbacteria bacterium RIFOXYB2_FULL_49_35]